jgi:hypothetical protein
MEERPMKRVSMAVAMAAIVASLFPAAVSADPVVKFENHHVGAFCDGAFEGGFASTEMASDTAFGDFALADVWLDDAIPFEDPATLSGFSEAVNADEGDPVVLSATLGFVDAEGEPAGTGTLVVTLTRVGDPVTFEGDDFGNVTSHTVAVVQFLEGSGTLTLPDETEITLSCGGEIADESVFETSPHAFTANNEGVVINCFWETDDSFAFFFAVDDAFGFFADANLSTADLELFQSGSPSGSIDATGVTASLELEDALTGDPFTADAAADFTPIGDPMTSVITSENGKTKLVEQRLSVDGTLEFSSGDSFTMDDEACFANTFKTHDIFTNPSGPKPGPTPGNDTPEGAIALEPGDHVTLNTSGTALDAEVPITTCPDGPFDDLGHTVWYTIEGTGDVITVDTAGSQFDTVLAVYVMEGGELVEIACVDDVFFDPIGLTFQAAISGPTEEGVTYWIQVGGFRQDDFAQSGRLKLSVE